MEKTSIRVNKKIKDIKLLLKEFINGSCCWNCKSKIKCQRYQLTKHRNDTTLNCTEKNK